MTDPPNFAQIAYENRIIALKNNNVAKSQLSSAVIETWINDTLNDAGHLEIPGVILKPESHKPLSRYGIDRNQLRTAKLPPQTIDRIYRALFVYSLGFFEMLNKALSGSP